MPPARRHHLDERREVAIAVKETRNAGQARRRPREIIASPSSSACATVSRSSTTRASPTRKRSTCSRPTGTSTSWPPASASWSPCSTTRRPGASPASRRSRWATRPSWPPPRVAPQDAQARHPRAAGRRLRLRLHAPLPERARPGVLREVRRDDPMRRCSRPPATAARS